MRNRKVLELVDGEDLDLLRFNPTAFWKGIKVVGPKAFENMLIKELKITSPVKKIGEKSFYGCEVLYKLELPKSLTKIGSRAFKFCDKLIEVEIPDSVSQIGNNAFSSCKTLTKVKLPKKIKYLEHETFSHCTSLREIEIPSSVRNIGNLCFQNCTFLDKISIPKRTVINGNALYGCYFKYYYINNKEKRVYFSSKLPEDLKDISKVLDLQVCYESFYNFDNNLITFVESKWAEKMVDAARILKKLDIKLPYIIVKELVEDGKFNDFIKNSHFTFFKKEVGELITDKGFYSSENYVIDVFSLAITLGCYSKEKMLDKNGKETDTYVYQKASTLLAIMKKHDVFNFDSINPNSAIRNVEVDLKPNQNFLNFLLFKEGKDRYPNLELMLELNNDNPNIFSRIIPEFDKLMSYRNYVDEQGKPRVRPWKNVLEKFLLGKKFFNVTEENYDIAEEFSSKDLSQLYFDEASKIRKAAKQNNVPAHLLRKELKEENVLESINKLKNSTTALLADNQKLIDELYQKQFTYEFLDKYDPKNFVLGTYCSCCASINSIHYGSTISKVGVFAEDVQNLVVRDSFGKIIGKGTFYLNKELGYIVFNDFEINAKYKIGEKHDKHGFVVPGKYEEDCNEVDIKERKLIFDAFMRGIKAFVTEYDKQNTKNPIKQVNVGLGHNRLQQLCEQFEWTSKCLKVPNGYCFKDAEDIQCIVYKRDEEKLKKASNETKNKATITDYNQGKTV